MERNNKQSKSYLIDGPADGASNGASDGAVVAAAAVVVSVDDACIRLSILFAQDRISYAFVTFGTFVSFPNDFKVSRYSLIGNGWGHFGSVSKIT